MTLSLESGLLTLQQVKPDSIIMTYCSDYADPNSQSIDLAEAAALTRIFGNAVPVSSLKAQLGHTMGASGVLELAVTLEMARRNTLLPTANLTAPDEACVGLDLLRQPRRTAMRFFVKDCFAFGGINAVLVGELPSAAES